jgi:16S rRNA processing protein RimM
MTQQWIEIGQIVAAKGLQGELKVKSWSDFPERFEEPGPRWLLAPQQLEPQPVELVRGYEVAKKGLFIVKLAEVNDRAQAESLRGSKILVSKEDRLPLEEDEFHVSDLVGLEVHLLGESEPIGKVLDLYSAGSDLLQIELASGGKVFIPFVEAIVPIVDLAAGKVEISPPPGLLDLTQ